MNVFKGENCVDNSSPARNSWNTKVNGKSRNFFLGLFDIFSELYVYYQSTFNFTQWKFTARDSQIESRVGKSLLGTLVDFIWISAQNTIFTSIHTFSIAAKKKWEKESNHEKECHKNSFIFPLRLSVCTQLSNLSFKIFYFEMYIK